MERTRPPVTHAVCGGRVVPPAEQGVIGVCERCGVRIIDPLQLNPRGPVFTPVRRAPLGRLMTLDA